MLQSAETPWNVITWMIKHASSFTNRQKKMRKSERRQTLFIKCLPLEEETVRHGEMYLFPPFSSTRE